MGETQPQLRLSESEVSLDTLQNLATNIRSIAGMDEKRTSRTLAEQQDFYEEGDRKPTNFSLDVGSYQMEAMNAQRKFFREISKDGNASFRTSAKFVDRRTRLDRVRVLADMHRQHEPPGDQPIPLDPSYKAVLTQQLKPILHSLDMKITLLQYEDILIEDFLTSVERYIAIFKKNPKLREFIKNNKEKNGNLYEKFVAQEKKIEAILQEFSALLPQLSHFQQYSLLKYALKEDAVAKAIASVPHHEQGKTVRELLDTYPTLKDVPEALHDETVLSLKDSFRTLEEQIADNDVEKGLSNKDGLRAGIEQKVEELHKEMVSSGTDIARRLPKEDLGEQDIVKRLNVLNLPEFIETSEEQTVLEGGKRIKKKVKRKRFTESLTIQEILKHLATNADFKKEIGKENIPFLKEDLEAILAIVSSEDEEEKSYLHQYENASLGDIRADMYSLLVLRKGVEESDNPARILLLPEKIDDKDSNVYSLEDLASGYPGNHLIQVALASLDNASKKIPLNKLSPDQIEILHTIRMGMYADNVEKRTRDMFRVTEPWHKADGSEGDQDTRIAHSMTVDAMMAEGDMLLDQMLTSGTEAVALNGFIDKYKAGITEEIKFLETTLDLNAIILSLLSKRRAFGANTRASDSTRRFLNKREIASLNNSLPPELIAEMDLEWERYAVSFEEYLDAVEKAVDRYNTMVTAAKERLAKNLDHILDKLSEVWLVANSLAWAIPYNTVIRWLPEGARKWTGVDNVMVSGFELKKLVEGMKKDFESMKDILGTLDKGIVLSSGIVKSKLGVLRTINREAPPKALSGIALNPTPVPEVSEIIALSNKQKDGGGQAFLTDEQINQYEESRKQLRLADTDDQKQKAEGALHTAEQNIVEAYTVLFILPNFKEAEAEQQKVLEEHGIIPELSYDSHEKFWTVALMKNGRRMLVRNNDGIIQWKFKITEEWKDTSNMEGVLEAEKAGFESGIAFIKFNHRASEVQGVHEHMLKSLEEKDLPDISKYVGNGLKRLGEKVEYHVRKFHEYDQMSNIGFSIVYGTIATALEYKFVLKPLAKLAWNKGVSRLPGYLGGGIARRYPMSFSLWRGAKHGAKWATSPAYRMAGHLTKNPGMKIANFADDAERATKAMQAMRTNKIFAAAGREAAHLTKIEEAIIAAHKIPPTGPGGSWARTDIVAKWRILKEAKLNPTEIKFLLKNGWCGRTIDDIAAIMAKNGHALTPELKALGLTDDALKLAAETGSLEGRLAAASSRNGLKIGGKVIGAMAIGWQAYIAYERWQAYGESHEIVASKKQHLRDALMGNKEKGMPDLGFEKGKSDTEFVHKDSGIKINLKTLDSKLDSESTARFAEAMNSSAAVVVLAVSAAAGGPVGVAVAIGGIIVEITIDATIGEWEMGKKKEFLRDAPAWLLTAISVAETTGHSQFGLISNLTDNELSDLMSDVSKPEKTEIRHKLLYSILNNDLGQYAPSALGDLFADKEGAADVGFMDTFYKKDFQQFILPMFYARLGKNFGNTTDFRTEGLFKLKDIVLPGSFAGRLMGRLNEDEKTNYIARSTPLQIRQALRDAVVSYLPYLHARRTYVMRKKLADIRKEKGPDADDVITINGQKIKLSEVVALMNEETTYGTKENSWKPRRIENLTDEELANMNIPLNTLASVGRSKLYNQFVSDPIMRSKLADIYETDPSAEDFEGNSWPLAVAVNELVQHNVYNSSLFRTADERSQAYKMRFAQYKTGPLGGIEALSPEELSRQRLTEEINTYFTLHPSPSYGRKPEWEELLFPNWSVERTAPSGEVLSVDRPLVLINSNNAMYSDLPHKTLAKALTSLAPSQKDADFKNANLTSVVLDFDSFHMDKFMSGREPCTVVRASFFYTDETGQSFVMQRSMYMYKNAYRTQGLAHAADYKPTNEWTYVHGKEMHYSMTEFEFIPANASMRSYVELHMREDVTNDVIEESTKRAKIEEYSEIRGFFQADEVAEVLYAGEKYQPLLFLSGPADLDVIPGSPAFKLLDSLARVPTAIYEDRPTAVFVEFDYLPDGSITALATHVDSTAETSANLHHGDTGIKPIRRQAAKLRYLEGGYDLQPIVGTLNRKELLRDADYLLRYFGGADQVLKAAFYGPKLRHQKQIEGAMIEYLSQENPPELSNEKFYLLENNQALLVPNEDTTILFESRDISASRIVHKLSGSEKKFFAWPHSFDRIVIHHSDERADREYMISSAKALMRDSTLEPLEREQIIDWYCTPLSDNEKSLQRILNLFPEEISENGTNGYSEKLVAAILPKYEKAPNKKQYLIGLFEMMLDLNWVNEGNLDYLSKVKPIPMGYGALQLFDGIDPVEVNVFDYESPRLVLRETTGQFHEHKLKDGTVITSPKRSHSRYSLTKFSTFPGTGQYDWNKVMERQESGKPIRLNASDAFINPFNEDDKNAIVHFLPRRAELNKQLKKLSPYSNKGAFIAFGSSEYRKQISIEGSFSRYDDVVLKEGAYPSRAKDMHINGVNSYYYGPSYVYIERVNGDKTTTMKFLGNALQLWDKWDRKMPGDMNAETRAQYEQELTAEERDLREDSLYIERWAIKQLTSPVYADKESAEYMKPVRRLVRLFPVATSLTQENPDTPFTGAEATFARFEKNMQDLYRRSKNPEAFLQTLFVNLEKETKGKSLSTIEQFDRITKSIEAMPDIAASIIETDLFPKVEMLLNGEGFETASNNGELALIITRISELVQSVYGDPEGYLKPIFEREFHDETSGNWYVLDLDADGGYKLQAKKAKA